MKKWFSVYFLGAEEMVFQDAEESEWGLPVWVWRSRTPIWLWFGRFWLDEWFSTFVLRSVVSVVGLSLLWLVS
jgi:hypothetical protein